jgi:hypothetical protein
MKTNTRFALPGAKLASAALAAAALFAAPALLAATASYWTPSAGDLKRKVAHTEGDILDWSWSAGVKLKTKDGPNATFERKNLLGVSRTAEERAPALQAALDTGNLAGLQAAAKNEKNPIDREEASWEAARITGAKGGSTAVKGYSDYLKDFSKGNWAAEARIALAKVYDAGNNTAEALKLLDEAGALGERALAEAGTLHGRILAKQGKYKEAADKCEAAAAAGAAVRYSEFQLDALAWKGKALAAAKDNAGAKAAFEAALKVRILPEFDAGIQRNAKGVAQRGLAEIAGNTQEAYDAWLSAGYWLSYTPQEAECVIGALAVAEALVSGDKAKWEGRIKTLRSTASKNFRAALEAYDTKKAGGGAKKAG